MSRRGLDAEELTRLRLGLDRRRSLTQSSTKQSVHPEKAKKGVWRKEVSYSIQFAKSTTCQQLRVLMFMFLRRILLILNSRILEVSIST